MLVMRGGCLIYLIPDPGFALQTLIGLVGLWLLSNTLAELRTEGLRGRGMEAGEGAALAFDLFQ